MSHLTDLAARLPGATLTAEHLTLPAPELVWGGGTTTEARAYVRDLDAPRPLFLVVYGPHAWETREPARAARLMRRCALGTWLRP